MRPLVCSQLRLGIICSVLVAVAVVMLAACGNGGDSSGNGDRVRVVTTLPLFADFVREIGGDRVEVSALLPSGADPHTWEPAPSDVKKITQADLAFANGLNLEPAAISLIETNLREGASLIKLGTETLVFPCPPGARCPASIESISVDPHLWMGGSFARSYLEIIRDDLSRLDPAGATVYKQNLSKFNVQLGGIEGYVRAKTASIPAGNRKLVTTHDAFGYLAADYGLEIVAVVAPGPGQESTPEDVAKIVRAIEDQAVPAVFVEPQISAESDILRQAAEDAGVEVCTLYSDSLDDKVTSYIELMRFDADELARCLGGE